MLVKIALFAILLVFGAYNRYRIVPARDLSATRKSLAGNVVAECLLLLVAFAADAMLANTPPPH